MVKKLSFLIFTKNPKTSYQQNFRKFWVLSMRSPPMGKRSKISFVCGEQSHRKQTLKKFSAQKRPSESKARPTISYSRMPKYANQPKRCNLAKGDFIDSLIKFAESQKTFLQLRMLNGIFPLKFRILNGQN